MNTIALTAHPISSPQYEPPTCRFEKNETYCCSLLSLGFQAVTVDVYKVLIRREKAERKQLQRECGHVSPDYEGKAAVEEEKLFFRLLLLHLHLQRASCIFSCTCSIFSVHSSVRPSSSSPMTAAYPMRAMRPMQNR